MKIEIEIYATQRLMLGNDRILIKKSKTIFKFSVKVRSLIFFHFFSVKMDKWSDSYFFEKLKEKLHFLRKLDMRQDSEQIQSIQSKNLKKNQFHQKKFTKTVSKIWSIRDKRILSWSLLICAWLGLQ